MFAKRERVDLNSTLNRTNVLVVVNSLELGGTQINAIDLACALKPHGFDSLLVGRRDPYNPDQSLLALANERSVPIQVLDNVGTTLSYTRELRYLAKRHHVKLVHTYGAWTARYGFLGPGMFNRIPLVMTVYEMFVPPNVFVSPHLIVGTRYLLEDLVERRGPVHLISPPVNLTLDDVRHVQFNAFLRDRGLAPSHVRVVMVTRLAENMKATSVEIAMRAVERLRLPDIDLVIVGTGDAEPRLRQLAEEINCTIGRRAIVLTGQLVDPRPAYASADIVLGMGSSAARSLAFGKPLVVVGENGWSQTFTPKSASTLFRDSFWSPSEIGNPIELLCNQLGPLALNPSLRIELGGFGRQFAEANFGLEEMAARLAIIYREALVTGRQPWNWVLDLVRCEAVPARDWLYRTLTFERETPRDRKEQN